MGLLDAISGQARARSVPSLVFYGDESVRVERQLSRLNQAWKRAFKSQHVWVAVVGFSKPEESERSFLLRLDDAVLRGIQDVRSTVLRGRCHYLVAKFNLDDKVEESWKSQTSNEALLRLKNVVRECESTADPWKGYALLFSCSRAKHKIPKLFISHSHEDHARGIKTLVDAPVSGQGERGSDDAEAGDDGVPEGSLPAGTAPVLLERYERAREAFAREFGLRRSEELADAIHSRASNRALVASKWRRAREVFAVSYGGRTGYPAFEFDPVTARPRAVIAEVIAAFPPDADGWRLALWFASPNTRLSGRRPVDLLDSEPQRVVAAAQAEAAVDAF